MFQITNEFINQGKSVRGGWTRSQLKLIGVPWPPKNGWKLTVIGKYISEEDAEEFLATRGMKLCNGKKVSPWRLMAMELDEMEKQKVHRRTR